MRVLKPEKITKYKESAEMLVELNIWMSKKHIFFKNFFYTEILSHKPSILKGNK